MDASTQESLKKIDRPLFKDYWPRFLNSLQALSEKVLQNMSSISLLSFSSFSVFFSSSSFSFSSIYSSLLIPLLTSPLIFHLQGQRTVYRLTLVKQWNTEELESYASLVARGKPDFIEIKVCQCCHRVLHVWNGTSVYMHMYTSSITCTGYIVHVGCDLLRRF